MFVASSDEYWLSPEYKVVSDSDHVATSITAKVASMRQSLSDTVFRLQDAGHEVVLIQTIPHFAQGFEWNPAECTLLAAVRGCPQSMPLTVPMERSAQVRAAVEEVGRVTGARVLDFGDAICPGGVCLTDNGRMPVYRDGAHITVAMSHALEPLFAAALADPGDGPGGDEESSLVGQGLIAGRAGNPGSRLAKRRGTGALE